MRKILTALLAVTALLALAACDSGNGGGGGGGDSFSRVEKTLTESVTSTDGFDFTGTWDCRAVISVYMEGHGTEEQTQENVAVVTSERATVTVTKMQRKYAYETEEAYNQKKGADVREGWTASFDGGSRTITLTATKETLDAMNKSVPQRTYAEFVEGLDALIARGATVTTNSGRTAIKVVAEEEGASTTQMSTTQILVKRQG